MKKFFFSRFSSSKTASPENSPDGGRSDQWKNRDKKISSEDLDLDTGYGLRRSRSFSTAAIFDGTGEKNLSCLSDRSRSSTSSGNVKTQHHSQSSRFRALTPERHAKTKQFPAVHYSDYGEWRPTIPKSTQASHDRSRDSSLSSSDVSNEVLDLYVDGEQEQHYQRSCQRSKSSSKNHTRTGGARRPPRVHCTMLGSPTGSIKENIIHSYRGAKGDDRYCSARDWVESEFGHESSRELAKHVVEKLCQSRDYSRSNPNDHDPDVPITIEDVHGGSLNRDATLKLNNPCNIEFPSDTLYTSTNGHHAGDCLCVEHNSYGSYDVGDENDLDERPTLVKELDRRSNEWSLKVESYEAEEQRLRERVRELAEQNVALQREVSSFNDKETERSNLLASSEKQINDLTSMLQSVREENQLLHQMNSELQDKRKMIEEDRDCIQRSYGEREEECKELRSSVARLLRTYGEHEKTIDGLRSELVELVRKNHPMESSDKHIQKLQMELVRTTGVEQALRREIESHKQGVDSLRHENVQLLERLKACGKGGGFSTFKLDEELSARLLCLEKQGLSLLNESFHLSSKLLETIKRMGLSGGKKDGFEGLLNTSCLDAQFVIESDMKVQGFKRGTESLMRSLQNISTTLSERSELATSESKTQGEDDDRYGSLNGSISQDLVRTELKSEKLLASVLRDKLYSQNEEIEHMQTELATAARGNDVLRCEVQNALDSLSCVTHKMKDLELQMIKKDDKIIQLQNDLQERITELSIVKEILCKVTEERDVMWEEVKQHTEKNMLLIAEVNTLKKKIEALEEDTLVKEGQISILKDSLDSKSFDLLASPDRIHEFLLE